MRKAFVCLALLFLCGCIDDRNVNGGRLISYQLWVPAGVMAVGLVAIPIGLILRRKLAWAGWSLMIIGPIAAIVMAPSLYRDRVEISDDRLFVRTGIWGLTAVHDVEFAKLKQIRITAEVVRDKNSTRTNYFYNCDTAAGVVKVPVNNALTQYAAPLILESVRKRGIPIQDATAQ